MLGRWNGKALLHQQESVIIRTDAFLQGWGGMQRYQDSRSLEPVRTTASHTLPKVSCSNSGSKIVSEGSRGIISFTTAGQSDSCGLHQQHGGTVLPQLTDLAKVLWLWALSRDIILSAEHIPGTMN